MALAVGDGRFDVCIVGGSIAGSALACHLAGAGFSVCVFERRRREERKLCAELTHVKLLERLRDFTGCEVCLDTVSAPLDRVEVVAGEFRLARSFELGRGITVDRLELEGRLLDRASALGAAVHRPVRVGALDVHGRSVSVRAEGLEVEAEVVVGADGAASMVGRRLARPWRRDEIGAARHVRLPIAPAALAGGASTVRFDLLPDVAGYGWLVPYKEEIGIGVGGFDGPIDDHFRQFLADYEREVDAAGRDHRRLSEIAGGEVRGAPVPAAGPSRPTWGERFLLVGDAGGFVSPASGEGLSLAVSSVQAAASALKLCFAAGRFGTRRLRHYERLWKPVMPDFEALARLRDMMAGPRGLLWLRACETDLERLALLAPLVGSPELGQRAEQILARLQEQGVNDASRRSAPK